MNRPPRLVGCPESAVVVLEDEVLFRDHLASLVENAFRRISSRRAAQVSNVRIWDDLLVFVDELPILVHQVTWVVLENYLKLAMNLNIPSAFVEVPSLLSRIATVGSSSAPKALLENIRALPEEGNRGLYVVEEWAEVSAR